MDRENAERLKSAAAEARVQDRVGEKLSIFLNRLADDIDQLDRSKRLALFRQQIKAHQYLDGNFYGYVDANCEWQQLDRNSDKVWYWDNQFYPYIRTALMELSRSQTEVIINAAEGAPDELQQAAKFAQARYNANRDRTFNARLKQTEALYALLNGISFRYTFTEFDNERTGKIPNIEETEGGKKGRMCAMCATMQVDLPSISDIADSQPTNCPSCGSDMMLDLEEAGETEIGYNEVPTARNAWVSPNPVSIIVSMQASCVEETPFIKWKQVLTRAVLESKYQGVKMPAGDIDLELRYISNQQKMTPGNVQGATTEAKDSTGEKELEPIQYERIWLDYPLYCNQKFDEDVDLGRGKVLPAGQPLGSVFPKGLYFSRVQKLILETWDENKNRKWTSSPYAIRPGSMYGSGSSQALKPQETLNDIETLKMANAWSNGVPREFVDADRIPELSADPGIPTAVTGMSGNEKIVGRAYDIAPATTLSAEVYGITDNQKSSIQNAIGALSGTGAGGLQDAQKWGDTATAISIKRDLAVGRFSPDLELMADQLDRMQAYQFLENEQEFFSPSQWEAEKGKYGDDALEAFLKCDVRRDLIITIAAGSHMPKSDAQIQAKALAFANVAPAIAQMGSPELMSYYTETFGLPEAIATWSYDKEYAQKVIARLESLAELFVQQQGDLQTNDLSDPVTLARAQKLNAYIQMPVDVFLDNHPAQMDALRDWRMTDEGQSASNVLLASVAYRLVQHQQSIAKQQQLVNAGAVVANQPITDAAKAEQAAAQEAQTSATEDQAMGEGIKQLAEYADRDDARQHEQEMQQSKQAHEAAMQAGDHRNQQVITAVNAAEKQDSAQE